MNTPSLLPQKVIQAMSSMANDSTVENKLEYAQDVFDFLYHALLLKEYLTSKALHTFMNFSSRNFHFSLS
jgi:hypothetical protein